MTSLFGLLTALMLYLGSNVQVQNVDAWRIDADGTITLGATYCFGSKAMIRFYRIPDFFDAEFADEVQVEEYLHAAACLADGGWLDTASSLDPTNCETLPGDCAHSWTRWAIAHPEQAAQMIMQEAERDR